jgi:hypothetical protein
MATQTFTVTFNGADCDIGADAMAAVFNNAADRDKYVAIREIRARLPGAINVDTTAVGLQGILSLDRISAASGGTALTARKYDTNAAALPAQVVCVSNPASITYVSTFRRVGDVISSLTILKSFSFQATLRAPNVVAANDHTGRTSEASNIWHADGVADTEPIVLREGEGIAIVKRAWGVPQSMHLGFRIKVVSTGNDYRFSDTDVGTPDGLDQAILSLMNGTGSGVVLQVYVVYMPDLGEENMPRFRIMRCETKFFGGMDGEAVSIVAHDTAASITEVTAYKGPMRLHALASGLGARVAYHDYQILPVATMEMQKPDTFRVLGGARQPMRQTTSPGFLIDQLTRGDPEIWPGDRRGVNAGMDDCIILRPNEGIAIVGGGSGFIEASKQAYLDIEICGFVYTPEAGARTANPNYLIGVS